MSTGGVPSRGVLLDHAQHTVAVLDETGQFTYVNAAAERILGREPAALVGENAFESVHPEDVQAVRAAFDAVTDSETYAERTVEYRVRAADGSWVWLESRISNLTDDGPVGYVVSSADVTDRVEAERECREIQTRLAEISATTGDVLWLFTADWSELRFVNPAYEALYGQPVDAVEENPEAFIDAIHPDDRPAVREAMDCLAAGRSVDMEYRVNPGRDYGVSVWVQAEPIFEDGEVVRIAGFSRDVTERKRRERQLYVMDNLLRHNLRNDLEAILGNAELVAEQAPEVADRTAVIRRTGRDLLASAEKEREILDLLMDGGSRTQLDLTGAIERAAGTIRERYPAATVDVSAPDEVVVRALAGIHVALVELLENAIVHSDGEEPAVRVSVRVDGDRGVVEIADEGQPLPEMEAAVLRGDHEMDDIYHSSGLGLWLVYWLVELSDGGLAVDTDESGNRIELSLPRDG